MLDLIGVVLGGESLIGCSDLLFRGTRLHAEYLVRIFFGGFTLTGSTLLFPSM
jgi:hypothetical protein